MGMLYLDEMKGAHARAFSVATSLSAERLQAMGTLVRSLVVTATPWPIAKTALQQARDALVQALGE